VNAHLISRAHSNSSAFDRNVRIRVSEENDEKLRQLIEDYWRFLERFEKTIQLPLTVTHGIYPAGRPGRILAQTAAVANSLGELKSQLRAWLEGGPMPQEARSHNEAETGNPAAYSGNPHSRADETKRSGQESAGRPLTGVPFGLAADSAVESSGNILAKHLCYMKAFVDDPSPDLLPRARCF
jgi:hypothetical protein